MSSLPGWGVGVGVMRHTVCFSQGNIAYLYLERERIKMCFVCLFTLECDLFLLKTRRRRDG